MLEKLEDVKVTFSEKEPMGFTLHFHFAKNDYFTNTVLTKQVVLKLLRKDLSFGVQIGFSPDLTPSQYEMRCEPEEDPFSFEGPEIFKCSGTKIDWVQGKNLTVKQVLKHFALGRVSQFNIR